MHLHLDCSVGLTLRSRVEPRPVLVLQHSMHHLPAWWLFPKDWILDFRLWIPELSVNSTTCPLSLSYNTPCTTCLPAWWLFPKDWILDFRLWIPELSVNSTTCPLSLSYYTPPCTTCLHGGLVSRIINSTTCPCITSYPTDPHAMPPC